MHDAFTRGKLEGIVRKYGDTAYVYVEVLPDACDHCKGLYHKSDGTPIIFMIRQLLGNGTNIGRKSKQWKPVVPPLHPWCRCELFYVPAGYEWDSKSKMFTLPKTYVSPVGRKSKVRIRIDNKEITE
jgi:hypothetical protein